MSAATASIVAAVNSGTVRVAATVVLGLFAVAIHACRSLVALAGAILFRLAALEAFLLGVNRLLQCRECNEEEDGEGDETAHCCGGWI